MKWDVFFLVLIVASIGIAINFPKLLFLAVAGTIASVIYLIMSTATALEGIDER